MRKTLLCFMVMSIMLSCIKVSATESTDTVLYEQDFESYTGGRFETVNETAGLGKWTAMAQNQYLKAGTKNDNTYLYLDSTDNSYAISMTYTFNNSISKGMVAFSYDISHSGEVNNVPRLRMFDQNSKELLMFFINANDAIGKVCGAKPDFKSNVGYGATNIEYREVSPNEILKVTQVLNFDEDYFETYINGEFLDRVEDLPFTAITGFGLYGYNTVNYFDNLSIKTLGKIDCTVTVTGDKGGDGIEITLPETMEKEIKPEDVVISDKDSNPVTVKEVSTENGKATVKLENSLAYDEKYSFKLNTKDKYGRTVAEKTFMSKSEVDENGNIILRVKNVTAVTADDDEIELSANLTPEISQFKIEFNTFVGEVGDGIKLNGTALNGSIDEKIVTADIGGLLIGDTDYTLTVDENVKTKDETPAKPYSAEFTTDEGMLNIKEFAWETENGEKAAKSDITSGKKLKLMLKVANTTEVSENMYLSYSVFSGNAQKSVMFKPVLSESGKYDEFYLEYTVSENIGNIRGIAFNNFTSLSPVADCAVID